MPDELHRSIKKLSVLQNCYMNDIYDQAVETLLKQRNSENIAYLASPDAGKYRSLWLNNDVDARAKMLSKNDSVPLNRVIYTALVQYTHKNAETLDRFI